MIDPSSFKIRFPEFDSVLDARIQIFIDEAVVILNEEYWGTKYDLGLNYYTAHLLASGTKTENGNSGSAAPTSGRAVDGVSVSYATGNAGLNKNDGDAWLNSKQYGQRYINLRNSLGVAACAI